MNKGKSFKELLFQEREPGEGDPPKGGAPDIQTAARDMISAAHEMDDIIETLKAVNMDRLAKRLESLQTTIERSGQSISAWTIDWQRRELRHNESITFGLLGVAVKMNELEQANAGNAT